MDPKYPSITVQLIGTDGNAFAIIGKVSKALRKAEVSQNEINKFTEEATSGDYDNLLKTCAKWVNVQ